MKTSDFSYELPPQLIAQTPAAVRDASRLLCLDRRTGAMEHRAFSDLPKLLRPGDRLVLNDTRVLPARLHCHKSTGAAVELLFVQRIDPEHWIAMARPGRRMRQGAVVFLDRDPRVKLAVDEVLVDGNRLISLNSKEILLTLDEVLLAHGEVPLPPYINREPAPEDRSRYQTVYAQNDGAVAAPTAGLHFTNELLAAVRSMGVGVSTVTLHVGLGTFKPVSEDDPLKHHMHAERYVLSRQAAEEIAVTRAAGGRVIAVGTTVVRVLEHCAARTGGLEASEGTTKLFILPGFAFHVVDGLITNFHLPQSTLLMLVSAFAGRERVLAAYEEAVRQRYRFFSYGDAMLVA